MSVDQLAGRYFDCVPLSAPITKVDTCRSNRAEWKKWTPGLSNVAPPQCQDCGWARELEAGQLETRTLAEVTAGIDAKPPPERVRKGQV